MKKQKQDLINEIIKINEEGLRVSCSVMSVEELQKIYIKISAQLATAKAAAELLKKIEENEEKEDK